MIGGCQMGDRGYRRREVLYKYRLEEEALMIYRRVEVSNPRLVRFAGMTG
jgi:hypothetical protein